MFSLADGRPPKAVIPFFVGLKTVSRLTAIGDRHSAGLFFKELFMFCCWRRRIVLLSVAAALLIVLSEPARAWNDAGHMLVARIAWLRMSPEQRTQVCDLLKQHPHYESYLTAKCPPEVAREEWAFLRAATWSDYIRPPKTLAPEKVALHERHKFHRGVWHYVNFPYRAGQSESALPRDPLPNQTNIVDQIDVSQKVLQKVLKSDPGAVMDISHEANRAVRVCWLFHLIGDLHQPLHAVALVDDKLFPEGDHGDQGGNLLAIRPDSMSKPQRLHSYWDGILGYDSRFSSVCDFAELLARDPTLAPDKLEELATHKQPRDWAAESYAAAKTHVYRDGKFPLVVYADVDSQKVAADQVPAVSTFDGATSRTLARRRMVVAGHRLAETLKSALGK